MCRRQFSEIDTENYRKWSIDLWYTSQPRFGGVASERVACCYLSALVEVKSPFPTSAATVRFDQFHEVLFAGERIMILQNYCIASDCLFLWQDAPNFIRHL